MPLLNKTLLFGRRLHRCNFDASGRNRECSCFVGNSATHGQIRLIRRFSNNITVLYDGDVAGINAALRGIDLLLEEGMNVKVVLLPDGEDPDSFARKQNAESFTVISTTMRSIIRFKNPTFALKSCK